MSPGLSPHEHSFEKLRGLFTKTYSAPKSSEKAIQEAMRVLEGTLLKDGLFSNNILALVDHGSFSYPYVSQNIVDVLGIEASVFLEKGLEYTFKELILPEDGMALAAAFEKLTQTVAELPVESRIHTRFNYDHRYRTPKGTIRLYQQSIPMLLNDAGFPYLVLGIVSDISEYNQSNGIHYRATLNVPGEPIKVLFTGTSLGRNSPLTEREEEIVRLLAEGFDSTVIAQSLQLSEETVRTHRKNILKKIKAKNSVHLVRMAVANGWI